MQTDNDNNDLLSIAVTRIRDGELPCDSSPRIYAGLSSKARCGLCGQEIASEDVEYEISLFSNLSG